MSKRVFTVCACILFLLLCAGCSKKEAPAAAAAEAVSIVTPPGQLPIVTQPVTLTLGVQQSVNVTDYENNYLTKLFQDKTGVSLKFQFFAASSSDANTQFELMVSAGEKLPDLLLWQPTNWRTFGDSGIFVDMTPYYEKYAYFYNEAYSKIKSQAEKDLIRIKETTPGGKRVAFAGYFYDRSQNYRSNNFINKTWLDKLGLSMPTTTDEFEQVLIAFRDKDPNGNGKKDEIPFIGSISSSSYASEPLAFLINAFVYYPLRDSVNDYLNATDGTIWAPWVTEEYREALRYISRLYKEGLIAPATFTMSMAELIPILSYKEGETPTVGFFSSHQNQVLMPETPAIYDYQFQVSLTGPKGVNFYPKLPNSILVQAYITKDCAYPDVAFRFLDLGADPAIGLSQRYGEEGVDWKWIPSSENAITSMGDPAQFEQINMIWGVPQSKHWSLQFSEMAVEGVNDGRKWVDDGSWSADRYKLYQQFKINDGKDAKERVDAIVYTKDEEDQIREMRTSIQSYREECLSLFCTGQMDIDKDWNTYLSNLDKMGLKTYLEVTQRAYARTIGK